MSEKTLIKKINHQLDVLEKNIPLFETLNEKVSKGAIGWHIEHCFLVIRGVTRSLPTSNPEEYRWEFNKNRLIVFTTNFIPRGRANAPASSTPKFEITLETLTENLSKTRNEIQNLDKMDKNHFFKHPFFGQLKVNKTVKFLELHTEHHIKIINDILK